MEYSIIMSDCGAINLNTTKDSHFHKNCVCGTEFASNRNMKRSGLFDRSTFNCTKNALDYLATRNRVLSSNVANVNTPGYKTREVSFKDVLDSKQNPHLRLSRTNEKHFPADFEESSGIPVKYAYVNGDKNDGKNDVDLDKELLKVGEVQTNFAIFSQVLKNKYQGVAKVIDQTP